ncbi:nitroreductase family protein [Dyella tabacisoli]|uniref:Putative NAD(P)H nitroreductase n=1 Tax=Dyella tabacisoli TaxID=2282381 RepID=A0A369URV3_9GAMM|nr:nitroreductase [Dyella tabacisoli]RDD83043.1 nitroreductase [Dyella tabacisoli]
MSSPLALLLQRHSAPSRQLSEPAPDEATLHALLEAAIRVPDHGKLVPFRLILLRDKAKLHFGEQLTAMAIRRDPDLPESNREKERMRYTFAPLVIAVIARVDSNSKIPEIEQKLSAGCVAHNLLLGAYALGYGAQWLTGWAAYDRDVAALLGLAENEHVIGFVHLGTPLIDIPDRDRPVLTDLLSNWSP